MLIVGTAAEKKMAHQIDRFLCIASYEKGQEFMRQCAEMGVKPSLLTVEKLRQKAEATLHVSGSAIHADATEENMYAAIDLLADKLDRCIKKHKEKLTDHHAAETRRAIRI